MSDATVESLANHGGPGTIIEDPMDYIDFAARYYGDEEFKKRVDADPAEALRSEGVTLPENVQVKLLFSDIGRLHIVLPPADGKKR